MGVIKVSIPDSLEAQLRKASIARFGSKKGDLSKIVEAAIREYLKVENMEKVRYRLRGEVWTPWNLALLSMRARDGDADAMAKLKEIEEHSERIVGD